MFKLSSETISYQNNDLFPNKLEGYITSIYKDIDNGAYKDNKDLILSSPYIKKITTLINERFNMSVVFDPELHLYYPAAIIPFFGDYLRDINNIKNLDSKLSGLFGFNNIVKHLQDMEKDRRIVLERIHNKSGYVDIKAARVGGYLSLIKHYLIINFIDLKELNITPSETVAVILHELGHAFSGLESHHRLEMTNTAIADILADINNNKLDKAVYKFKKHFNKKEFENVSVNSNKEINDFYGKIALSYLDEIRTQMTNNKYDETNFENTADMFVARFNVGKDLVSGLDKLNKAFGNTVPNTLMVYGSLLFIDILNNVLLLGLFPVGGVIIASYIILVVYNVNNSVMTYDFPVDRYNRIRNSIINNLKNTNLPKKLTVDLLAQLDFIDSIIKNSLYYKNILNRISDSILISNKDAAYYIDIQQGIENSLNNMLFVKASQLSVMK